MKTILKLFGLDLGKPLEFLFKVLVLLDNDKLVDQLEKALCLNMKPSRQAQVAGMLREAASSLEMGDCHGFATTFVEILRGIKF